MVDNTVLNNSTPASNSSWDQEINTGVNRELETRNGDGVRLLDIAKKIGAETRKKILPKIFDHIKSLPPRYLIPSSIADFTDSFSENNEIVQEMTQSLTQPQKPGSSSTPNEDIAEKALREQNQENGMGQAAAEKKAQEDAAAIEPPAHKPTAAEEAAKPEVGAPGSQGEKAMEAGAEGPGPEAGQTEEDVSPAGERPQSEPETVAPGEEEDAGRRMRKDQQQPEANEAQPETTESAPGEAAGAEPSKEDTSTNKPENDTPETPAQNEEQDKNQPQEESPDAESPEDESAAEKSQTSPEEQEPETVEPDDERDKQKQLKKQQGPGEEAEDDEKNADEEEESGAKKSTKGIKAQTEAEIQKALTPVWQEIIDSGWEMYGVGWLITFPVLLYLLYLDWTKQGIQLPFVGKIRVVKINIIQKVDAATQITLAFLCWGVVLAIIFLINYGISSL